MTYASVVTLLVVLASCQSPRPQSAVYSANPKDDDVLNAEHAWVKATMRQDANEFASFMDDAWVGLVDGKLITKAQWTNEIRAGTSRRDSVQLSNLRVRFPSRDVAVVTGGFVNRAMTGTREQITAGTYVNTWTRIDGRWKLVSSGYSTMLKSP